MTKFIEIDKDKLYGALKKRGLTPSKAGREMGFSNNYISMCGTRGTITEQGATLLSKLFNIAPDEYLKLEESQKPAEQGIDYDKLYQTIYVACFHAFKAVMEGK